MPMGDYSSFEDCVKKNQDKDNPEAYCGAIKAQTEAQHDPEMDSCMTDMMGKGKSKMDAERLCNAMMMKKKGMEKKMLDNIIVEYYVPLKLEEKIGSKEFTVSGIAVEETISRNGIRYLGEELEHAVSTLEGKPIIKDHDKKVDHIVGKVTEAKYDKQKKAVTFKGRIMDDKMKEMINDGRIQNVSIGASVANLVEEKLNDEKIFTAKGITFEELSLVVVPGIQAATISQALGERLNEALQIREALNEVESMEEKEKVDYERLSKEVAEMKAAIGSLKPQENKDEELKKKLEEKDAEIAKLKETLQKKELETKPKATPAESAESKQDNFVFKRTREGAEFYRMPNSNGKIIVG